MSKMRWNWERNVMILNEEQLLYIRHLKENGFLNDAVLLENNRLAWLLEFESQRFKDFEEKKLSLRLFEKKKHSQKK